MGVLVWLCVFSCVCRAPLASRSPVALPALTGVLLQTRGGPLPAISACSCSGDARFDSGLVPLPGASCAPTCSRCSLLEQLVTCMLVRSHGIVVLVLVLGTTPPPGSWIDPSDHG